MYPTLFALLLAASQNNAAAATAAANSNDLSLVCHIEDWSPPPFVSTADAARARLNDDDRKWLDQYEKSLRDKSRDRENGNIGVNEFDRSVDRSFGDAAHDRPDLKPILESITAKYSRTIGVDQLMEANNERMLTEHEASKSAKPLLGKYVQLRYVKGLVTWQESLRKIVENAPLETPDPQSGLKPSLSATDSTITFVLTRTQDSTAPRTTVTIDRYTGEFMLEKNRSDGELLYSLSGLCDKQTQPRF